MFSGTVSVGTGLLERGRLINASSSSFGWPYEAVLGLERGEIYPVKTELCKGECDASTITKYTLKEMTDGRYNLSVLFEQSRRTAMVCDITIDYNSWKASMVTCYEVTYDIKVI